jgi:hypothetical protein
MNNGSMKKIEHLSTSDSVLGVNPNTGEKVVAPVLNLKKTHDQATHQITFDDGTHVVTTSRHPFDVAGQPNPVAAGSVKAGDAIMAKSGAKKVVSSATTGELNTVYNLKVGGSGRFMVTAAGLGTKSKF